jgi:uncharacterized OsmC-like protein
MQIRVKPKTYGPLTVQSSTDEALVFQTEAGHQGRGSLTPNGQGMSPSDLMLASLANCLAISIRIAGRPMAIELGALRVSAMAFKATDLPNRFGRFEVDIHTEYPVDAAQVDELLRRTKETCTVSNSLEAEVMVRLNT